MFMEMVVRRSTRGTFTHVLFGEAVEVVEQRRRGVVDEGPGDVLARHAGQDLLLGAQPYVSRSERALRHDCKETAL